MLDNIISKNNCDCYVLALKSDEYRIINNALCLYGNVLDALDLFNSSYALPVNEAERVIKLMKKIGEEI